MAIETVKDPISGKEMTLAKGTVNGVYLNKLKSVKTFSGPNGDWTPDKAMKVKIDNDFIQLGLTDKESIRCKDTKGDYHDLQRGMQVTAVIDVKKNGEYTNYDSKTSKITITDATAAPAEQTNNTGGNKGGGNSFKKDNSGVECGHALNAAMTLLNGKLTDPDEYLELAKKLHNITLAVKRVQAKNHPEMNDFAVGASAGNAVLNACTLLTKTKVDQVEEKALSFLEKFSTPLLAHIRGEDKKEEAPQEPETQNEPEANNIIHEDTIPF